MPVVPSSPELTRLVDHLFRREAGRLVAILTRAFGVEHLHLAEDVVQDALLKAMETWPFTGVPRKPSAWLLQTAKNRALDHTRRNSLWREKQPELSPLIEDCLQSALTAPAPQFEDEIRDSQLRMMFVCCHPALSAELQVALTLKTLCGFGESEIAAAFLIGKAAVTKRLVRARHLLRERGVAVELPVAAELAPRVEGVLQALYLLFNEGYKASHGDSLLRTDLCDEAIRLAELLTVHPLGDRPAPHALLALMHFGAARLPARLDDSGGLLVLAEQDRRRWDRGQIAHGMRHLALSGTGAELGRYHLEAGIAACHCLAPSFAATDWAQIVRLFDQLLRLDHSPLVALNRAVAVAQADGPAAGLRALAAIPDRSALEDYHLYHAVAGQLLFDAGRTGEAAARFRRGLALAQLPPERALLERRLGQCGA